MFPLGYISCAAVMKHHHVLETRRLTQKSAVSLALELYMILRSQSTRERGSLRGAGKAILAPPRLTKLKPAFR